MANDRLALTAHLLRRAGFGATREELEAYAARPYEEVVEELVHPERAPEVDEDLLRRFYPHPGANQDNPNSWNGRWFYRMVNSKRPLEEMPSVLKMIAKVEGALGAEGRVLVRYSGTEAKARVMIEGQDEAGIKAYADEIAETLKQALLA